MRLPRVCALFSALWLGPALIFAAGPADRALAAWREELPTLRIEEADLAIPSMPPPYFPLDSLETFFSTPTAFPGAASGWLDRVDAAPGTADLYAAACDLLGGPDETPPAAQRSTARRADIPPALADAVVALVSAMTAAQPHLDAARASMTDDQRRAFSEMFGWGESGGIDDELSTRRLRKRLGGLTGYQESEMRIAARLILTAFDGAIKSLEGKHFSVRRRLRWKTPAGDVMIGRSANDVYRAGSLDGVALLIETGGDNIYETPVAFAGPGQSRVAIDFGSNVSVRGSTAAPTAAASYFGVAAMAIANPSGLKRLVTGDYSQGATIGGAAALIVRGNCDAYAGHNTQGQAVAGVGMFLSEGNGSRFESLGNGQGAGFVRGVAVFRHRGNDATLRGGLVNPDPREPQGSASLCQGVGFGRRAFSGGGIGLCSLKGDGAVVIGSYFAQGAGYWHGAGAFRIRGDKNLVQGRRYDLGSGVHSAFGHFEALGDDNRILNWGVGPAYGWDHGVGSAIVSGDRVEAQAEWGTGTAEVGGRAFGYYEGKDGKLRLPWIAGGNFFRNESSYSLQVFAGGPHRVDGIVPIDHHVSGHFMRNMFGVLRVDDATFVSKLELAPPVWPEFERETVARQQAVDLQKDLDEARALDPVARVAAIADVAAAFSLDKKTPRRALEQLLTLPPSDVPSLVAALDPNAIEQLIELSIALAAHGDDAARALAAVPESDPNAALALSLLRLQRPTVALPLLEARLASAPRTAATAARGLGALINRDNGTEPGARAVLEAVAAAIGTSKTSAARKNARSLISRVRLGEAFGILSTAAGIGPQERKEFLASAPDDVTDIVQDKAAETFLGIVDKTRGARPRIEAELSALRAAEKRLRPAFQQLALSTDTVVVQAAVTATGQIGNGGDAAWVAPLLEHPRAAVREAAAVALGRMGDGGTPALLKALASPSPRTRALAAVGAALGTAPSNTNVLMQALDDPDPIVSGAAIAAMRFLPSDTLKAAEPEFRKKAARRLEQATGRDLDINLRAYLTP